MTAAEEQIRAALAAGPTPGPWLSAEYGDYGDYDGKCRVILGEGGDIRTAVVLGFDTPENAANAKLIAACNPANMAKLLAELDGLREKNRELLRWKGINAPRLEAKTGLLETAQIEAAKGAEAVSTLASEREANAILTDELTRERARSQMYADLVRAIAVVLHGPGYSDTSKLAQEVEALKTDAERYRWLRDDGRSVPDGQREIYAVAKRLPFTDASDEALFGDALDAAIDAAKGGAA